MAGIDPDDRNIEHVEVTSSHFGMNLDPDVWVTIAQRLDPVPAPPPG
jgi:extradiol dioxygenase family protein